MSRIVALFRLDFIDPQDMRAELRRDGAARPVWLALAMDEEGLVQMKPQNLLLNLPLAARTDNRRTMHGRSVCVRAPMSTDRQAENSGHDAIHQNQALSMMLPKRRQ
jgi:hypothetical protein